MSIHLGNNTNSVVDRPQRVGVQSDPSIGGLHSKQLNGDIRVEMMFATQLAGNVTLILLSEEPATLEIDQFNKVLI